MSEWDQFPLAATQNKAASLPPQENAWDAFPLANKEQKIPVTTSQQPPSLWDETKAVAGRALTGIGYAATAPEGAARMLMSGADWALGNIIPGYTEGVEKVNKKVNEVRNQGPFNLPSPAESVDMLRQNLPQPQTTAGKIIGAGVESIPSAVALTPNAMNSVPNALNAAMRYGFVPGSTSEAAGEMVKGSSLETPVRIGTSLLASGLMGMVPGGIKAPTTAPTTSELKQKANDAYRRVEQSNVIIDPTAYNGRMNQMFTNLANEGFDPTLHPKAAVALRRMDELRQQPVTMTTLENMRRIAKDAAASAEGGERRIGQIMIRQLDDFVDNLSPANTLAGNAQNVAQDIKEARAAWSQLRKSQAVERLQTRAEDNASRYTQSGEENSLRNEFRALARNDKKMALFSKEEQDAIRKVANPGWLADAARNVGKLSPFNMSLGPVASNAVTGTILYHLLGPAGALIPPTVGAIGKSLATQMTKRNAEMANQLMRGGPITPPTNPSAAILYNALMQGK